jgi:hypothetical protein
MPAHFASGEKGYFHLVVPWRLLLRPVHEA